ncbi:PilZ domain-containing protein [Schlegelella sp. S2-27]|uniref:PilZ domain-containing protein n=1 Tax=Caldimonas mangrovi TaxID=2944811 RepID=A0ABT0YNS8_9BURK|nr:PilZ domain-containing protein [Caldimonas mangrovi]MCM5680382.1 PilZ domain-containing protein [Caldimonas mangrovi]
MPTPDRDRRASRRAALQQECEVVLPGNVCRKGRTCELGLDGLSLLTGKPISPGVRCQVRFQLPTAAGPLPLFLSAKAVYSSFQSAERFRIGLLFDRLTDEDEQALAGFLHGLG